ncbi:DUF2637 domain-containing protein [Nocardiopsis sp. FR4]|uniref:DUF2637 domain-containing protein n=1 Tax=Nocardiopsis sp. FR4 TaxID=2605985 RepID=UPI00135A8517|nr:DUF2637 domain-containing protein [Nocardiopsis sp. FR4]
MDSSRWSRWTTIAAVLMLAVIAAVVSYSHMYELALRHGEPEWRAALFPLSVDGMIVASSMTLLSDARNGRKGGLLPWTLLIIGSGASLAANVAVADPTVWSRIIHAWPSFALIGAYELLMREFRTVARSVRSADAERTPAEDEAEGVVKEVETSSVEQQEGRHLHVVRAEKSAEAAPVEPDEEKEGRLPPKLQRDAWEWALENRQPDGSLPTGGQIADHFGRKERWGRLIKQWGQQGRLDPPPAVTSTVSR